MASSLFTALSGLKAHEDWLTVIGNNISNTNTPGFKSSRATFSDLFSQTLRFASLPSGNLGGRNPVQVGGGVQLAEIGRDFGQGALNNTGRTFDLALNGKGFFVVSDGVRNLYTRVGTFGLDGNSRVVDQRTGFLVQDPTGSAITIDTNEVLPPQSTSNVAFARCHDCGGTRSWCRHQTSAAPCLDPATAAPHRRAGPPTNHPPWSRARPERSPTPRVGRAVQGGTHSSRSSCS